MLVSLSGTALRASYSTYNKKVANQILGADKYWISSLAENAKTDTKMKGAVDRMSQTCDNFDFIISTKR